MKRTLTAVVAGLVVFGGALASAATLGGVTPKSIGASTSVVASCDSDGVTLGYTTTYDATNGAYKVSSVTVSGIAAACNGQNIQVSLRNTAGTTSVSTANTALTGTSATLSISPTYDVANLDSASVLIAAA